MLPIVRRKYFDIIGFQLKYSRAARRTRTLTSNRWSDIGNFLLVISYEHLRNIPFFFNELLIAPSNIFLRSVFLFHHKIVFLYCGQRIAEPLLVSFQSLFQRCALRPIRRIVGVTPTHRYNLQLGIPTLLTMYRRRDAVGFINATTDVVHLVPFFPDDLSNLNTLRAFEIPCHYCVCNIVTLSYAVASGVER